MGVRALARKYGVHRRTVREALASPVPAPRKAPERASPVLDAVAPLIDAMLRGGPGRAAQAAAYRQAGLGAAAG